MLCEAVTDAGLEAIAEGCKQLTSLDLIACGNVTDAGLEAIGNRCKQLTSLDLTRCSAVTAEGAARLRAALPACELRGKE